jgi:hypothetical protein
LNPSRFWPVLLGLLSLPAGADTGTLLKADALKAEPFKDAKTVTNLQKGAAVEILTKEGGWYQVSSGKQKGWVRMLSVKRGAAGKATGSASDLASVASGRAGTGKVVSTTGIRGLNEEELKSAKFNETEIRQAESYGVSRAEAQKFAAEGKLSARRVDYLPNPKGGAQ